MGFRKDEITLFSVVREKATGRKMIVTGLSTVSSNPDEIVCVSAKTAQGRPALYSADEIEVIRY